MRKWIFLSLAALSSSACVHLERSTQSGYATATLNAPPSSSDSTIVSPPKYNLSKLLAELGLNSEDIKTPAGLAKIREALEIKRLEGSLTDDREKNQYYKILPWLKNDSERLEFLQQNGYYARQSWLRKKSVGKRPAEIDKSMEDLIATKDIAVGMPTELVKRSWGSPDGIDVAGNPIYGNERWRYKRYTPSPEGYHLQSRLVYFEAGKVVGWEQIDH